MQRHGASGKPLKGQHTKKPKAAKTPSTYVSTTDLQERVATLTRELTEARGQLTEAFEYQTATGEVLNVISRSPTDVQPVFDMIAERAALLCEGQFCFVYRFDGQLLHFVAHYSLTPEVLEMNRRAYPAPPSRRSAAARAILERGFVQIPDINADPDYVLGAQAMVGHYRSVVGVPILRDGVPIGAIAVARAPAGLLPDRQVELLKTFADQAVIAIENVRLFEAEQQRTHELSESLRQQTATAEVLKIISSSPGELEPVFNAMLANATSLCEATIGTLYLYEGAQFRGVALHHTKQSYVDYWRSNNVIELKKHTATPLDRLAKTKRVVHIPDLRSDRSYIEKRGRIVALVEEAGVRTFVSVPMIQEGELIGAINLYRQEVRAFTDKQIDLVKNFAAQAVIAIQNTRLLNELRESLQQQTATSEVLSVISSSPGDLKPVFEAILANATRICDAKFGILALSEGDAFRTAALHGAPPAFAEARQREPVINPGPGTSFHRAATARQPVQIADIRAEPAYISDPGRYAVLDLAGARTMLSVPMLKEDKLVGIVGIYRQEVRPFTDKQIELLKNFAAQAVIAIENTRLLNELRESLQQQTATADVLRIISASLGELEPIFGAILQNATRICEAKFGTLYRFDGLAFYHAAGHGTPDALIEAQKRQGHFVPEPGTLMHRVMHTRSAAYSADYAAESARGLSAIFGGARSTVVVPMLKDDELVGAFAIYRQEVRPFTDKQIALLENFAAQAVIAIENARLLNELRRRTDELSASLDNLRATQDRLVQTEKLASLGQLTAGIAHEIKNPLNFVNNFSGVSAELVDDLQEALKDSSADEKRRSEIAELMDMLRSNLDKVVQHGKRADGIVKSMLLHSGESSGKQQPTDINALVEESLNRAYYNARAEQRGFAIKVERSFDPAAGEIELFPREITRALLNLISNGFYAATKRKAEANADDHEPTLAAATKNLGDRVEIRIRDNGTGIPADVKEKMFNPFFTTKPPGEGTGLGLSISYDIIVKQHGGSIEVDTEPGEFAEIRVILPRA